MYFWYKYIVLYKKPKIMEYRVYEKINIADSIMIFKLSHFICYSEPREQKIT